MAPLRGTCCGHNPCGWRTIVSIPVDAFQWEKPSDLPAATLFRHLGNWWMVTEPTDRDVPRLGLQLSGDGAGAILEIDDLPPALTIAPGYSWREATNNLPEDGGYYPGAILIGRRGPCLCSTWERSNRPQVFTLLGLDVTDEHAADVQKMPTVCSWRADLVRSGKPDETIATLFQVHAYARPPLSAMMSE